MAVELVTPGHSPPLDTLIALGIASGVLQAHPTAEVLVEKEGASYRIVIGGQVEWDKVHDKLSEKMLFEMERLRYRTGDLYSAFGPQKGIELRKLSETFKGIVELAREPMLRITFEYSEGAQHAAREGRGRGRRGTYTAYLPIAPWAGKYFTGTYRYGEEPYTLCPLCAFLAWSGLLSSSSIITYVTKEKRGTIYVVPDPLSVKGYDLALLSLIFGEKRGRVRDDVPLLAAPLLALATGETLWPVEGDYGLYVWKYEGAGAFLGIRGYSQLPLRPLLEFAAEAKSRGRYLARLIKRLDPSLVAQIAECLAYGEPDPYTVVRSVWSFLSQQKKRGRREGEVRKRGGNARTSRLLEKGFAEALFGVWQRYWRGVTGAGGTPSSATPVTGIGSWT